MGGGRIKYSPFCPRSSADRVEASGASGRRFKSCRGRFVKKEETIMVASIRVAYAPFPHFFTPLELAVIDAAGEPESLEELKRLLPTCEGISFMAREEALIAAAKQGRLEALSFLLLGQGRISNHALGRALAAAAGNGHYDVVWRLHEEAEGRNPPVS